MANAMSLPRRQAAAAAPASNTALYVGIGVAIGVICIAGIALIIVIIRKKKAHRRVMQEMEQGVQISLSPVRQMEHIPYSLPSVRCHQMMPDTQRGWDALASNESLHQPQVVFHPVKRLRSTLGLPKSSKLRPTPFGGNKYLSSIVELDSPISERQSPRLPTPAKTAPLENPFDEAHNTARPDSPKADARPSLAIRIPQRRSEIIQETTGIKATRSVSEGVLNKAKLNRTTPEMDNAYPKRRSILHARSLSLGAPAGAPPTGPVPPLPTISPLRIVSDDGARRPVCVSRMSTSSVGSTSSSVLISSPILSRKVDGEGLNSPTVETIVADDDNASLKDVAEGHWQTSCIVAPRQDEASPLASKMQMSPGSMRGSIMRVDNIDPSERKVSASSNISNEENRQPNRISVAEIATADRIILSRVSSSNSVQSAASVQKIDTPQRGSRARQSSVSASGSPAPRRRPSVLSDISGNADNASPTRRPSESTLNSARSTNGKALQLENGSQSATKPSALKGSPNARKGHRRQNCVRISTLTPQVLGPPARSQSASPATLMGSINEEGLEENYDVFQDTTPEQLSTRKLAVPKSRRPASKQHNSDSLLPGSLRVPNARGSLRPTIPTRSWTDPESVEAEDQTSSSPPSLLIPTFPTRSTTTAMMDYSPCESRPVSAMTFGADDDEANGRPVARFVMRSSSSEGSPVTPVSPSSPVSPSYSTDMASSPPRMPRPLSYRKSSGAEQAEKEYDPTWPVITMPQETNKYDPASPSTESWEMNNAEGRGSWFLPFADAAGELPGSSPGSGQTTPKTLPQTYDSTEEELTSSNAKEIMSRLPPTPSQPAAAPQGSLFLNSASMPILSPPSAIDAADASLPAWSPPSIPGRSLSVSARNPRRANSTLRNHRRRISPEPFMPTIMQSSSPPNRTSSEISTQDPTPEASKSNSASGTPNQNGSPKPPIPARSAMRNSCLLAAPSQSPTTSIRPSLIQGPRSAPAKSVLRNISELRRMNSEVRSQASNRESRNWARLGREPSPLLPWIGTGAHGTSQNALPGGEEQAEAGEEGGFEYVFEPHADKSSQNKSSIESVDLQDFERDLADALDGLHKELAPGIEKDNTPMQTRPDAKTRRNSTVWNDGEKFWTESQKEGIVTTTLTTLKGRTERMSQVLGTPGSLYDQDGFLKG
ncbi:unnamed protein product [Zymoseptoria tritici ST99CH_3D1]|nr:unnamed protein product [Zymoseptoria tritici ST99CH_3D1]